MTLLHDIVMTAVVKFDPRRNDFPVTLHDPCNMVRLMGIVTRSARSSRSCPRAVPRDGAARRGELLLRRRLWASPSCRVTTSPTGATRCPAARSSARSWTPSRTSMDPRIIPSTSARRAPTARVRSATSWRTTMLWEKHHIALRRPGRADRQRHGGRRSPASSTGSGTSHHVITSNQARGNPRAFSCPPESVPEPVPEKAKRPGARFARSRSRSVAS
jgi:hypothetical protein